MNFLDLWIGHISLLRALGRSIVCLSGIRLTMGTQGSQACAHLIFTLGILSRLVRCQKRQKDPRLSLKLSALEHPEARCVWKPLQNIPRKELISAYSPSQGARVTLNQAECRHTNIWQHPWAGLGWWEQCTSEIDNSLVDWLLTHSAWFVSVLVP